MNTTLQQPITAEPFTPNQRVFDSFRDDTATVVEVSKYSVVIRHDTSQFNSILNTIAAYRDLKPLNIKV